MIIMTITQALRRRLEKRIYIPLPDLQGFVVPVVIVINFYYYYFIVIAIDVTIFFIIITF